MIGKHVALDLPGIGIGDQNQIRMTFFSFNIVNIAYPELFGPVRNFVLYQVFIFKESMFRIGGILMFLRSGY